MEEINVLQEFMRCVLPEEIEAYFDLVQVKKEFGTVKLTVGVLKGSKQHIQYCITALEEKKIT